jgi:outer membrane protein assembly factor BamB
LNSTQSNAPNPLWSAELGQIPAGPPLVAGDLLLVPTQDPGPPSQITTLHVLSLVDGDPHWQHPFERALVSGLAALQTSEVSETSEVLALVSTTSTDLLHGEGMLVALDAAGRERWRWAPGVQRVSAPALVRSDDFSRSERATEVATTNLGCGQVDTVIVTANARTLVVLDPNTGEERASFALDASASLSAPALVGGVAIVPCRGPHLLAVGLDGGTRWHFTAGGEPDSWLDKTPVVVGEHVLTVLSTGAVLALRVADGTLAWRVDVGPAGKPLSPPATDGELLFVGARDGLHALDLADGREVWPFPTPRRITAAPVVAGGVVYAACHDHHLYALDAASGQELWRHGVGRRIEVSPALAACGELSAPCVLVADRGGTLTAIARPLSAAEHEAAGHWVEAACAYVGLDRLACGAELLEAHGEPLKAAELWKAAGEQERAAVQYEAAGAWPQAAGLWAALGRSLKQAEALEAHARSLEGTSCSDEGRAAAWAATARAFESEGEAERAAACQREVARCLRQPIIAMDVQLDKGLVLNAWSSLRFIVRNEGYGPACNLVIRASGDQFEGEVTATRQIATLRAGHKRTEWLDVRPLEHGDSVPLRVSVEYQDHAGEPRSCKHTVHIPVARTEATRREAQTINVFVFGSGAVAVGEGAVAAGAGGVAASEHAAVTAGPGAPASPALPGTTHVLSFDRLSPVDFERLCLWLVEREGYTRAEHLGLAGSELGRDVIAYRSTPHGEELWYFQCKRYGSIGAKTLKDEVDKYLQLAEKNPRLRPTGVVFVVSCAVSARVREEVGACCKEHGLAPEFWALTELDMRVKRHPDLLREFFNLPS